MSSTYSGGVGKLQLMTDGEQSGVWGQITNANLQTLEEMVSGYVTHDVAGSATTTLSGDGNVGSSYSATESKAAIIKLTGAVTGAHDIIAPAREGWFILWDASTGAYDLTFKPSGGTGVVVPSGGITLMLTDGSTMYTGPATTYTNANALKGITETEATDSTTSYTVDLSNGTIFDLTNAAQVTVTMPTAAAGKSFTIIAKTAPAWAGATILWSGGIVPSATTISIYSFLSDGTSWYGMEAGSGFA